MAPCSIVTTQDLHGGAFQMFTCTAKKLMLKHRFYCYNTVTETTENAKTKSYDESGLKLMGGSNISDLVVKLI